MKSKSTPFRIAPSIVRQWLFLLSAWVLLGVYTTEGQAEVLAVPPSETGKPVEVRVSMVLIDLDEINSADQNFAANFYYELRWRDFRLAHDKPGPIIAPLSSVWHPDIQIVNQQKIFRTIAERVDIHPNGEVVYRQRVWGHFSQPLDLQEFPLDRQTFELQLASSRFTVEEVRLIEDPDLPSGIADKFSLADWDVLSWSTAAGTYAPFKDALPVPMLSLSLDVDRKINYYTMQFILPLIFIVAMSWIAFWVHPSESGTQFSVGVTSMLTLIAYRFAAAGQLPKISYMTRMDFFIFFATVLVFLTLIEVLVTASLTNSNRVTLAETMDRWSRILFPIAFVILSVIAFFG